MSRTHSRIRRQATARLDHASAARAATADLLVAIVRDALDTADAAAAGTARQAVDRLRAMVPANEGARASVPPAAVERLARLAGLPEVDDVDFRRENGQTMTEPERRAWRRLELFASLLATAIATGDLQPSEHLSTSGAGPVAAS